MGISTGGNINISGSGNVVDLNVTGPAIFNTDIWVGGNIYNANLISGKDGLFSGNLTVLGNLRYTNVSVVVTDNLQFRLANNQSNAALLDGGGWTLGANNQGTFLYNNASESWQTNLSILPTANNVLNLGGPINHYNNLYVNNALMPGNVVAGNVSGTFSGNAGNLTNIPAANISGTVATANTVTDNAQPNITSTGTLTTLTVSGNVYATNLFGNVIGLISNAVYANTAGQATTANTVTSNLQPNINLLGTLTTLSVSGNSNVNIINASTLSTTGNITGSYILGNGSQLTGLPAGYANANAQSYFASGSSNANISITGNVLTTADISATGNVTGNYVIGNGSQLTGLVSVSGTAATVTANAQPNITSVGTLTSLSVTGNTQSGNLLTSGFISLTGNITSGNILTAGIMSSTGNAIHGNILTTGLISATGNILTAGLISATGNATAGNVLTAGLISSTGNITSGNILTAGLISAVGNATAGNILTAGLISATGNAQAGNILTAGRISSSGNILTAGLISAAGNATAGNILTAGLISSTGNILTAGLISVTGNATAGNILTAGLISVTGNASVGNLNMSGNIVDTGALSIITGSNGNISLAPNGTGNVTVSTNLSVTGAIKQGIYDVPRSFTGSWTLTPGVNNVSFTVDPNLAYSMWILGNAPNGIVAWSAQAQFTNTNTYAVGSQYGWYYSPGNALILNGIPDVIVGTLGGIINTLYTGSTSNVLRFQITNNTGSNQIINYGWTRIAN